ncbi:hypothetical protein TRAPUB_12069 [Trametes pubescens]|uniref:C-factor n=1 Tax=Trametes pubescens TaxID=154538 RepID=A0A1M2VUW8_TRAPU|nr:hypothetical protein TRAPUB_12069 [Trametes pubescens]
MLQKPVLSASLALWWELGDLGIRFGIGLSPVAPSSESPVVMKPLTSSEKIILFATPLAYVVVLLRPERFAGQASSAAAEDDEDGPASSSVARMKMRCLRQSWTPPRRERCPSPSAASRGIGLEIVRQLLASLTNLVVADARTPEKATVLHDLQSTAKGTLHVIKLDVSNFDSVRASAKDLQAILGDTGLDYLNNAGIASHDTAFTIDPDVLLETFKTNTAGPVLVSQVALPFLEKGSTKKILHISSTCGSIGSADQLGVIVAGYSMTKSALNMLAYKQKLERPDLTVITLCPGAVKTDISGGVGELEPPESVAGLLKVIISATPADSGKYLRYNGETIPW